MKKAAGLGEQTWETGGTMEEPPEASEAEPSQPRGRHGPCLGGCVTSVADGEREITDPSTLKSETVCTADLDQPYRAGSSFLDG